jgi:predicted DNA-binding transcriptional regulator AlpA
MTSTVLRPVPPLMSAAAPRLAGVSRELASVKEIAAMLAVNKRTAARYVERDDFPEPVDELAVGRIWRRSDVEEWATKHLPLSRPGRPPKT